MIMRILLLSLGQDLAGIDMRTKQGFDRLLPDWKVTSISGHSTYLQYPRDLLFEPNLTSRVYVESDVVHLSQHLIGYYRFDKRRGIPIVLQHHGTQFRNDHVELAREAERIGAIQIASTIDLTLLEPGIIWVPAPYNLATLMAIRETEYKPTDRILVTHAPTDRAIKSTDLFIAAMRRISERHPNVDWQIIERQSWAQCLRSKAKGDIYYDQVTLGYGCNAIEAWAMGIPVIAGAADPAVIRAMRNKLGELPFYPTTEDSIETSIENLLTSSALRDEYSKRGLEYVRKYHDDNVVIPKLADIYRNAKPVLPFTGVWRRTGPVIMASRPNRYKVLRKGNTL